MNPDLTTALGAAGPAGAGPDSREWLETNGLGSFASGTVGGPNTRRYHALLCLAALPPQNRAVLVNKLDESLVISTEGEEHIFELGANFYPGAVHPQGYKYLQGFRADPLPTWRFEVASPDGGEPIVLEKCVWMPHEAQATVVSYRLVSGEPCTLRARPFITGRDFHGIHRANAGFNTRCDEATVPSSATSSTCTLATTVRLQPYEGQSPIVFSLDGAFCEGGAWYYAFQYPLERERGLSFEEDAWSPGYFEWKLSPADPGAILVAAGDEMNVEEARQSREREIGRRRALSQGLPGSTSSTSSTSSPQVLGADAEAKAEARKADRTAIARLARSADQFIVRRRDGLHTILAGYPWFGDWGRDTMIALPGLCLSTGRTGEALSILLAFSQAMSRGMIPNRFPDAGEVPDYNTIDATLWFFHAVRCYLNAVPDDSSALEALYPALRESIEWHIKGTRFGIRADEEDGLLLGGDDKTQLTWMDAKVGDTAFTPRAGKAVEIQALWYNALCTAGELAASLGDAPFASGCAAWARKAKASFSSGFWNQDAGCLYDFIQGEHKNAQIRPNQIFALSLPNRLLPLDKEKRVLRVVERELLTPHGLRSLSPRDSQYRGHYGGDQWSRDSAYHQGTVWSWPIGALGSAFLRVHKRSPRSKVLVRAWLQPLVEHLDDAGLNSISEIFDGDAPHAPRGCFAQAWGVAEVLRVLVELQNDPE